MSEKFPYHFRTQKEYHHGPAIVPSGTTLASTNADMPSWEKGWGKFRVEALPEVENMSETQVELGAILVLELAKLEAFLMAAEE